MEGRVSEGSCRCERWASGALGRQGPAGRDGTNLVQGLPQSLIPSFSLHQVPRAQRVSGGPDVVLHAPQSLIPSSRRTTSPGPSGPSANPTWCFTPRKPLLLRPGAPRPRDPEAHRVPALKTKAEGNSRPRISLPLTVGGNFPLFPTAPSPLGAVPIGKHFRPTSVPEVLPIPNPEAHSIRPGLNGLSSPQNRNGSASGGGSAALPFPHNQKGCAAEKHLLFSEAHPSHFHKNKRKRRPRRRFPLLPLFFDCSLSFFSERIPISPSLPTSFPSAGRFLPCRRCWRKPSRSRFCPGSGKPSSFPARNPHRPCQNPFSPPG